MKRQNLIRYNRLLPLGGGLLGICLGLYMGRNQSIPVWLCLVPLAPCVLLNFKKIAWLIPVFFFVGMFLGLVRGGSYARDVAQYDTYYDRTIRIIGTVSDDPGYSEDKQTEFHISGVHINKQGLPGRVRIRARQAQAVGRGDKIQATGTLRRTLGTGRQGALSYATVSVLRDNNSWVEQIRSRFFAAVFSSLPEPQASLGLGYLVGVRTALPKDFALALSVVGLTHIVAVSGYNLTIIVQFVKKLFEKVSAYQTVLFSALLIAGFLVMTGWSPSITRAAVISGFSLLAWYYGRKFHPVIIILLGAAITGFINPLYIWGDVGWYLSFLAFTGVLLVAPLVTYFLGKISKNILVIILIETLCAQLLTMPYISHIFERVSLISPLANVLVIPFIPLAMLLVFIVGMVGIVSPVAALWISFPAKVVMSYTVWVVERLASLSWAQTTFSLSTFWMVAAYAGIGCATALGWLVYKRRQDKGADSIDWNLL